jgi:hypothetical protein
MRIAENRQKADPISTLKIGVKKYAVFWMGCAGWVSAVGESSRLANTLE